VAFAQGKKMCEHMGLYAAEAIGSSVLTLSLLNVLSSSICSCSFTSLRSSSSFTCSSVHEAKVNFQE